MGTSVKAKNAYLAIGAPAAEVAVQAHMTDISPSRGVSSEDTTTYGQDWESSVPTLKNGAISGSGIWNATIHNILAPLLGVEGKSIIFGPEGNGAGKIKESCLGYLSKYDRKTNAKGIVTFDWEITPEGAITDGVFP